MPKLAELTTQQIVTIVIILVSFAIILIFIVALNLGEASNKEICHKLDQIYQLSK